MTRSKGKMTDFIHIMYGTVMAVAFYKISFSSESNIVFQFSRIQNFIGQKETFRFFLFLFTFLVLAHDWYAYNSSDVGKDQSFWSYGPQIMALFFISQMFVATERPHLQHWFFFGFWHSLCNIWNYLMINGRSAFFTSRHYTQGIKYLCHLILCSSFFFTLDNTYSACCYYCALAITVVTVIGLWYIFPVPREDGDGSQVKQG